MRVTSAQANKRLKMLMDEKKSLLELESQSKEYNASVGEDPEKIRPEYDYEGTQAKIHKLDAKIMSIKHAINVFNVTTELPGLEMTVDQALIRLPQLTELKQKYLSMKDKIKVRRVNDMYSRSNIVDYTYLNYDKDEVKADFDKITQELIELQLKLDEINSSVYFDIED